MAKKYHQGMFRPKFAEKYAGDPNNIVFRSGWEKKFMHWCDNNPAIVRWASEEISLDYVSPVDQRKHRYFVDFIIQVKTKTGATKTFAVEVKPFKETLPPTGTKKTKRLLEETATYAINTAKWAAARKWCAANNLEFIIITENELGI